MKLRTRIMVLIGVIVLGGGIVSSLLASRIMGEALYRELCFQGGQAVDAAAQHITPSVVEGDVISAREAMLKITERVDDIDFIYVVDFDGKVFAHTFNGGFPKALGSALHGSTGPLRARSLRVVEYETDTGGVFDVSAPLIRGMAARIHIGMNDARARAQIVSLRSQMAGSTLLFALAGTLIAAIVTHTMTRPLAEMVRRMLDFGEGRTAEEVVCEGGGPELADLTRAFNRMISDRGHAENALRNSEERYRAIAEDSPLMICRTLPGGEITYVNSAYCRYFGMAREDLVGTSFFLLIPEADRETVAAQLAALTVEFPTQSHEHRVIAPDGEIRWQRWTNRALFDSEGKAVAYQDVGEDITERRRVEKTNAEQARLLDLIFQHTLDSIVLLDKDYNFIRVSETYARAGQRDSTEFPGHNHFEFYPSNFREEADEAKKGKYVYRKSARPFVFPDHPERGITFWDVGLVPILDEDGEIELFLFTLRDVTEQKRAERAGDDQRALLNAIVEGANDAIFVKDLDGRYLLTNSADADGLGKSVEEVIGTTDADLFPPQVARRIQEIDRQIVSSGEPQNYEQDFVDVDGETRTFLVAKYPRLSPEGQVAGVIGLARDITERKCAERTTKEQARLLDLIFKHSLDSIVLLDKDYDFIRVNDGYARACQRDPSEFPGHNHFEFYPSDLKDEFDEARKGKHIYRKWARPFVFPDHPEWGTTHWDIGLVPILDDVGDIELFLFTLKDVTERKQAEEELRKSERSLAMAQELAHLGNWDLDLTANELWWSDEVYRIFGLSPQQFGAAYEVFLEAVHPDDRASLDLAYRDSLKNNTPYEITHRVVRPDGVIRVVREQCEHILDENGIVVRSVGTVLDVTEAKRAEEERLKLEEQLRRSHKMEAIGQLAGGVAHDFNNLLTAILGNSEMLLSTVANEAATLAGGVLRPRLEQIQSAGEQAACLTRQLLAFSRREITRPVVLDSIKVVRDMEEMLRWLISEDIQLDVNLGSQGHFIHADPGQIEQVIMNLVINAADAMPNGGRVEVRVEGDEVDGTHVSDFAELCSGPYVVLRVTDNGTGMTPNVLEHVFEPFFTTKPVGKGTGLGLATVYGTVKQLGGHISVDSEPGTGSTFTVYLPVVDKSQVEMTPDGDPARSCAGETLLVCEDQGMVRTIMCQTLSAAGYAVIEAKNGRQALDAAAAHSGTIDLLVSDVVMPGLNGRELADSLALEHPNMGVLFVSGHAADHLDARGVRGADEKLLHKPFGPTALLRCVREALDAEGVFE